MNNNNTPSQGKRVLVKLCAVGSNGIYREFLPTMLPEVQEIMDQPRGEEEYHSYLKLPSTNDVLSDKWLMFNLVDRTVRMERNPGSMLFRNAIAIFIVVDQCEMHPLQGIMNWVRDIDRFGSANTPVLVVGYKRDPDAKEELTESMLKQIAAYSKGYIIHCYCTSKDDPYRFSKFEEALSIAIKSRACWFQVPLLTYKLPLAVIRWNYNLNPKKSNNQCNNNNLDQVFKQIIRNKSIMVHIWQQVKEIHKLLKLKVNDSIPFLIDFGYYDYVLYKVKNGEKVELNLHSNEPSDEFFKIIRCNDNFELFKLMYQQISHSLKTAPPISKGHYPFTSHKNFKSTIMDDCIIGGSNDIIRLLGSNGYKPSIRGLRLSILFGDVEMVSYIIEKVLTKSSSKKNKSTALLESMENEPVKDDGGAIIRDPPIYFQDYEMKDVPGRTKQNILKALKYYTPQENQQLIELADLYGKSDIKNYLTNLVFTKTKLSSFVTNLLK